MTPKHIKDEAERLYPSGPTTGVRPRCATSNNSQDLIDVSRAAYIRGATRVPGWIDCEQQEPEEFQPCAFVVISTDPFYNNRVLGGTYQGKKRWGYEFTIPGIGYSARYWQPLPAPPVEKEK